VDGGLSLSPLDLQKMQTIEELEECNALSAKFGLCLSDRQIAELAESRFSALKETGRVEFGRGILKMLVEEFCDSPFITRDNYAETVAELQDSFYYFKNESMDRIPDCELVSMMRKYFDGVCKGSLEYLNGTSLEELCRAERRGYELDEEDELF